MIDNQASTPHNEYKFTAEKIRTSKRTLNFEKGADKTGNHSEVTNIKATKRKNYNIEFLRDIAITAIVLHHTLCIFAGWPPNADLGDKELPLFLINLSIYSKSIGLGLFTFIAGYVLNYSIRRKESFLLFLKKKTVRLLVPCVIFAILYAAVFPMYMLSYGQSSPINGTHLWYLPMLFLCVLITDLHAYIRKQQCIILIIGLYIGLKCINHYIGFRTFSEFIVYFPVFYIGFWFGKLRLEERLDKHAINLFLFFLLLIAAGINLFGDEIATPNLSLTLSMSVNSIFAYLIVFKIRANIPLNPFGVCISRQSFTIYLLHQFVIDTLLYIHIADDMNIYGIIVLFSSCAFFIPIALGITYDKIASIIHNRICFVA